MHDPEPIRPDRLSAVYVFGTCLIDTLFPQAGLCAMRLLRRAGLRVIYPQGQTCCGQPAYNSGYRDEALRVARAQLAAFPLDIPIVVPSASCAGMLRVHYQELFAGMADQARAEALSRRVYELTEFLVRVLDVKPDDLGPPVRVALHNSCSARREAASRRSESPWVNASRAFAAPASRSRSPCAVLASRRDR